MIKNFADKCSRYGDHVICTNCSEEMIINLGDDICPNCGIDGALMWADESCPEVEI